MGAVVSGPWPASPSARAAHALGSRRWRLTVLLAVAGVVTVLWVGWDQLGPQKPPEPPYNNCAEARAAHAAPIERGQPGYRPALDRDGDGIACE